ncbi:hypothetical protein XVE_3848, partial [Xanthomonas vesicatoria ATCC 35937]
MHAADAIDDERCIIWPDPKREQARFRLNVEVQRSNAQMHVYVAIAWRVAIGNKLGKQTHRLVAWGLEQCVELQLLRFQRVRVRGFGSFVSELTRRFGDLRQPVGAEAVD